MISVVFRVDASSVIGSGHVTRCLTLADRLSSQGARVQFVMREHRGHAGLMVAERGYELTLVPVRDFVPQASSPDASWLGTHVEDDARDTAAAIAAQGYARARPDWLIVDHYAIDQDWERLLRPSVGKILVIDDLADRRHECDALLDQNLVAGYRDRYDTQLPPSAVRLLGPRFVLLQPPYEELAAQPPRPPGPIRRVLIYFGAADAGLTLLSLTALLSLGVEVQCDVVCSTSNADRAAISALASTSPSVTIHGQLPSLAVLMAKADLAIGAGGATSWERLCVGVPSIVVTLAENQEPIAHELGRLGLVNWVGGRQDVDLDTLRDAIASEIEQGARRATYPKIIDGRGAKRVSAYLCGARTGVSVRPALPTDESLLLDWANDPTTRNNAFSSRQITADEHHTWFSLRLVAPDWCRIYVAQIAGGVEIGQTRFEKAGDEWFIHYAIAPEFRGRKLAATMLRTAIATFSRTVDDVPLAGDVVEDNAASHRVFLSLGFRGQKQANGSTRYVGRTPL